MVAGNMYGSPFMTTEVMATGNCEAPACKAMLLAKNSRPMTRAMSTQLQAQGIEHRFHDFKKQGVPPDALDRWLAAAGWEVLVNRKGTTWRGLDEATRNAVTDDATARALLLAHASVIKRPVVVWADGTVTVGFSDAAFQTRVA